MTTSTPGEFGLQRAFVSRVDNDQVDLGPLIVPGERAVVAQAVDHFDFRLLAQGLGERADRQLVVVHENDSSAGTSAARRRSTSAPFLFRLVHLLRLVLVSQDNPTTEAPVATDMVG